MGDSVKSLAEVKVGIIHCESRSGKKGVLNMVPYAVSYMSTYIIFGSLLFKGNSV